MDLARIRNFSIIAHIDHGKSHARRPDPGADQAPSTPGTCAAVPRLDGPRARAGHHDQGPERARRLEGPHVLHLIDTPGHVDFGYEVSRSLAACEGVVLVVDAAQGIEAQTLANCYLALEHDLEIVAALNKIDLPAADPDRYADEIENVLGIPADDILRISAKTGEGVGRAARRGDRAHPRAHGRPGRAAAGADLRQPVRPVPRRRVSSVRVMNGRLTAGSQLLFMQAGTSTRPIEIGVRRPVPTPVRRARTGRGRLPHRRHQGRRRGPQRRDGHRRAHPATRAAARATATRSRWCSAACTRSTATTSRTCARAWRG